MGSDELKIALGENAGALHERLLDELGDHVVTTDDADLFILLSSWRETLQTLPTGAPRVAVITNADSPEISEALDNHELDAAVHTDFRPGELLAACLRTWTRSQRQLLSRNSERYRLELMVESMADGLLMTDTRWDEVLINPAARRLLEIDDKTRVTQSYLKERLGFYPFALIAAQPDSNELLREELSIGDKRLHSMISPVRAADGSVIGAVLVLRDFTATHTLAHRQEEFVAVVSHELRSPLTSISGALDIALSEYAGQLTDKQRRYLSLARTSCTELNRIVDDLLDVARTERGSMQLHFGAIDLGRLTAGIVKRYQDAASSKGIDLQLQDAETRITIAADPDRLGQVLNNLLSNALKFTPLKGKIEVEVFGPSVTSSHVGVSVFNNGEVIAEDAKERIFQKFEQIKDTTTRRVGGSGLGLAISRAIIEAHGGRIWVESGDRGARFIFTLPAGSRHPAPEAKSAEMDMEIVDAPRSGKSVVLVDADQHSSYIRKGILIEAGHDVFVADDPDSALVEVRRRRPALVVILASQGLRDPLALVEILEHDPDTRHSAILVLSPEDLKDDGLRARTTNLLSLPILPGRFQHECSRLIKEAEDAHGSRVLVVDDDASIRTICVEVLKAAGLIVGEAANGLAALSEAKRFRPDLLLLDVMMPDLDGFQTAEYFKADPATAMTPIIFLSARGETADKVHAFRIGAEDYIVKPFVADELVARIRKALERSHRELGASPTTQLPGGGAIEKEVEARLSDSESAFCYLDLDNLKAYNDYYGYAKADAIIRQTGDVVREAVSRHGGPGDFIGHIAGDDFVFITTIEHVDQICAGICASFDRLVPLYYNRDDREAGFIETKDRYGVMRKFPLISVSIAAITGADFDSYSALAQAAAVGKKMAKAVPGTCYLRDGETIVAGGRS